MFGRATRTNRRRFLKTALGTGAALATTHVVPSVVMGRDGATAPSGRITVGGIGIGSRGSYDLGCFLQQPDVQFIAVCDVKESRRQLVKKRVDAQYKNQDCDTYRDLRELLAREDIDAVLIATGPNWHCAAATLAARAGKDIYCEKPCTKNIVESLALAEVMRRTARVFQAGTQRRSLPHFQFAVELARTGKLGKLTAVHAAAAGFGTGMSGWPKPDPAPPIEQADWDLYLGPAAWRPHSAGLMRSAFHFEKGGGLVGGGVLEWGSHCVDLCQWAADADLTAPVEYHPATGKRAEAFYENGVKLVLRDEGWLGLGSCPVRFEGETGWVEAGDSGKLLLSSPELLAGRKVAQIGGYPATFHVRNFLDCVKSRALPRAHADAACWAHIACHALNIAIFLKRKVNFDLDTCMFIDDEEANRLRSEAHRAPWRV